MSLARRIAVLDDLTDAVLNAAFIRATRLCKTTMPDGTVSDEGC